MSDQPSQRERLDEQVTLLYSSLRLLAGNNLRQHGGRSISPTEIVHECYLKLAHGPAMSSLQPPEFIALASRVIRSVLVDRARYHGAMKRGDERARVTLSGAALAIEEDVDLLLLDEALQKLALLDERQSKVVELKFFGGLSSREIATILDCSERTVSSQWAMAKAWLHREIARD